MEWHIITGSKGGVGKTLLSLLLVAHCLEDKKRQAGSTLLLDLNGMNADSSALLLYRANTARKRTVVRIKTEEKIYHQNAEDIVFQTVSTDDSQGRSQQYVVGWLANPFMLMNPQLFADLLITITTQVQQIEERLTLSPPLRHIIIDTNYHFCNIFGQQASHYTPYQQGNSLHGEEINVWFLWVYRQLEKLIDNSNEGAIILATAMAIEQYLNRGGYCNGTGISNALLHAFTPVSLMANSAPPGMLQRLVNAVAKKNDYVIPEFEQLEQLKVGKCVQFGEWITVLNHAYNAILKDKNVGICGIIS